MPLLLLMHSRDQLINFWREKGVEERILQAFLACPRELYVSPDLLNEAYDDKPLPTLRGQSLSQPTTIMVMTQALQVVLRQTCIKE